MNAHVSTTTRVIARCWKVQDSSLTQMCQTAVQRTRSTHTLCVLSHTMLVCTYEAEAIVRPQENSA